MKKEFGKGYKPNIQQFNDEARREVGAAFNEYHKLAIRPCTNPSKADLEPLEKAIEKYEAICEKYYAFK